MTENIIACNLIVEANAGSMKTKGQQIGRKDAVVTHQSRVLKVVPSERSWPSLETWSGMDALKRPRETLPFGTLPTE
jgi:hypothetical protein